METKRTMLSTSIELAERPSVVFDVFVRELTAALAQEGLQFEPGADGRVTEGTFQVGSIVTWKPAELIALQWQQASWEAEETTRIELRFEPVDSGTLVSLKHQGWGALIGGSDELTGWFAGNVATPFLKATAPSALGDWLTDRQARRPAGAQAREVYRDPLYHYPNFQVLLQELALTPDDYLLEIGCGGGALLKEALKSGCRAAAVDHSAEMVQLAQEENHQAVAEGRLAIYQADAHHLPFSDATFTRAVMTGVFGFLADPVAALREIRRMLLPGGKLVMLGSDPELRGTVAASEPAASRLHFYDDAEFRGLAEDAGFTNIQVMRRDLEPFARQVGVPQEHLTFFAGQRGPFLIAQKN